MGPAWVEAAGGNQLITSATTIPTMEAIAPTRTIWPMVRLPGFTARDPRCSVRGRPSGGRPFGRLGVVGSPREARFRGPEAGRGCAVVAPERLGELGRLAVAHAVGDLADRQVAVAQQLTGPLHADAGQVLPERGLAHLGVAALQLAPRRGDPAGDVVEREVVPVLLLDDRHSLLEEASAQLHGGRALDRHRKFPYPLRSNPQHFTGGRV